MKIKINNSFLLVFAIMILLNGTKFFSFVIFSCMLHEFSHILAIKMFKVKIEEFKIGAFKGKLSARGISNLARYKIMIIYFSGIFTNFLVAYCTFKIGMLGFYSYNMFLVSGINLLLGFFNLLPIYVLDGYYLLLLTLSYFKINVHKICFSISIILNITLIISSLFFIKYVHFSIVLVGIYLLYVNIRDNFFALSF